MKNFYFFIFLMCTQVTLGQIDAGIVNPSQNLIIHEDNRDTYVLTNDLCEVRIDGWSNTGQVSSIRVYTMLGTAPNTNIDDFQGFVSNPNTGSWIDDIDVTPGINNIYINVRCDYPGCTLSGTISDIRTFEYVKPYDAGNFLVDETPEGNINISILPEYGIANLNTGYYYRVFRNTNNSLSGGTYISSWSHDIEIIDTGVVEGQTYYYWVDVARNNSGSFNSGLILNESRTITTLNIEDYESSKKVKIYPNPFKDKIFINNENFNKKIKIYTLNGKLIDTIIPKGLLSTIIIDLTEFSKGVYFLKLETDSGVQTHKIIKE